MEVDAVLDQDAKDRLVLAIAPQPPGHAIGSDEPHAERLALPDRFGRQASEQRDRKNLPIPGHSVNQPTLCGFEPGDLRGMIFRVYVLRDECVLRMKGPGSIVG